MTAIALSNPLSERLFNDDDHGDIDPFALFEEWFAEARVNEPNDPHAMALATVERAALFLVGQEIVGSRNLGEFRLRLGVVGVLVGVIGLGQLAISRLQVLLAHRTRNPEHGVWVAHGFLLNLRTD